MYKFTSFDEETFYKAIEEKDYSRLKTCIISSIRNNPGFRKARGEEASEARLALNILKERVPEMFEVYAVQEAEHVYNENEAESWNKEYFIRQTFLLGENFCMERYSHLLKIGKKITNGIDPNFQEPQEQGLTTQKTNPLLVLGVVALAIIVLVVIIAVTK